MDVHNKRREGDGEGREGKMMEYGARRREEEGRSEEGDGSL